MVIHVVSGTTAPGESLPVVIPDFVRGEVTVTRGDHLACPLLHQPHAWIPARILLILLTFLLPTRLPRTHGKVAADWIDLSVVATERRFAPLVELARREIEHPLHPTSLTFRVDEGSVEKRIFPVMRQRKVRVVTFSLEFAVVKSLRQAAKLDDD